MSFFDWSLNQEDIELTTEFMMLLGDKEYFSADDLRELGLLERFTDPAHQTGTYFAKLKANKVAEPIGEIPSEHLSNNQRKVDLFRWNWQRWREIIHNQITEYV